jgi:tryptophan synthase alpha chain
MNNRFEQYVDSAEDGLFIPFITAGDPSPEVTVDLALLLEECGANAIELGIPYSDPLADGPVIQKASARALKGGMTLEKAIRLTSEMRKRGLKIPVIIFTYYNLLLQLGKDQFFTLANNHDVDGLLVPDLPFEESEELRQRCEAENLPLISLVAPTTSQTRLEQIAGTAKGFVYCVSSLGVTGVRDGDFSREVYDFLHRVKEKSSVPVAVGFGISNADQIDKLKNHCDGVIIGSAIVRQIEKHHEELLETSQKNKALEDIRRFLNTLIPSKATT